MYIKRHLETTIEKLNSCFKVLLVTGRDRWVKLLYCVGLLRQIVLM